MQLVRQAVELVEDDLGHPREQLDDRDAGVADVVVRPLGAVTRYQSLRLVDDVLKLTQVQPALADLHRHTYSDPSE